MVDDDANETVIRFDGDGGPEVTRGQDGTVIVAFDADSGDYEETDWTDEDGNEADPDEDRD